VIKQMAQFLDLQMVFQAKETIFYVLMAAFAIF
jgi:hypothetical protein